MLQLTNDLYAIVRCAIQFRGDFVAPMGLKSCHIGYLSRISHHPGISQDQLAQMMLINKSNVARQVAVPRIPAGVEQLVIHTINHFAQVSAGKQIIAVAGMADVFDQYLNTGLLRHGNELAIEVDVA